MFELLQQLATYFGYGVLAVVCLALALCGFGCIVCFCHNEGPVPCRVVGGVLVIVPVLTSLGWLIAMPV